MSSESKISGGNYTATFTGNSTETISGIKDMNCFTMFLSGLGVFATDIAAAAGGVPLNGLYWLPTGTLVRRII